MRVYKFGGASVKDAKRIQNVGEIIQQTNKGKLLIVVSAMGKMTNALETVMQQLYNESVVAAEAALDKVKSHHLQEIVTLFDQEEPVIKSIMPVLEETSQYLKTTDLSDYDKDYDQIVSTGEILSTKIVSAYLRQFGLKSVWHDARLSIMADNTYREGKIDWQKTEESIKSQVNPLFEVNDIVVTQGFIGQSSDGLTITLGREGSDFTASIFSYCLDAESMSIWKDVPGILTADPRRFENLTKIDRLSYREAIEMTYYGAKVIHPKTIKPIQNKSIPLHVRSFMDPSGSGTIISDEIELNYPPVIVVEDNQALVHISTKDFSFVAEHHLSKLFDLFTKYRVKVNMMRNTAISFSICTFDDNRKLDRLKTELESEFKVLIDHGQELITVRHFNQEVVDELKKGKIVLFEERLSNTLQMVVKNVPIVKRKDK